MDIDDKVCDQVSLTMLGEVYPKEVIERCVQQSEPWSTKARRVRLSTALTLVFFVIAMALWSRRNQCLQAIMRERCQLMAQPSSMPSAFFGRYRLMAIDGTVFNTADTPANAAAFGRSSNQYGPGAYPQVRCVLLAECGPHAVVGLEIDGYEDAARAWGAPFTGAGRSQYAGPDGRRHHLGRVHRARTRARGSSAGGLGSRGVGTPEPPTPTGRWRS